MSTSLRNAVLELALDRYGTQAEYLWSRTPNSGVLRHPNGKWYGAVLDVPQNKLGLPGEKIVDILDIQCDPRMAGSLRSQPGILPGYHMNKEKWITIVLDGTVPMEQIAVLLEISYDIAGAKAKKRKPKQEKVYEQTLPLPMGQSEKSHLYPLPRRGMG